MRVKLDRKFVGVVSLIIVVVAMLAFQGAYAISGPADKAEKIIVDDAVIKSIDNSTVTAIISGSEIDLFAKGRWVVISDEIETLPWIEAMKYVESGDAVVAMATVTKGNQTGDVLLGVKQGDLILVRPILLKHCAKHHKHASSYLSFRGTLIETKENYMILERDGHRVIALANGKWIEAGGEEEVTWADVRDEFKPGDQIRLFYHDIAVFNEKFENLTGIKALIWSYSGAILDLTSGTTLSRK